HEGFQEESSFALAELIDNSLDAILEKPVIEVYQQTQPVSGAFEIAS
ncbi:unnamed protein product, partial [marine sediment metagenome]